MKGIVYQINVKPKKDGERGLPKLAVNSALVSFLGLDGDYNKYRHEKKNDDPNTAVLLMPLEMIQELNKEGWPIKPGDLGENITTSGIAYSDFAPGKKYRIGGVEIEISEPCDPCTNLSVLPYIGKDRVNEFIKAMMGRRGWCARVLKKGKVEINSKIKAI